MRRLGDNARLKMSQPNVEWSPKRSDVILYLLSVAAVIAILYL